MQHYVIKFVSNLWQVVFFFGTLVSSTNKTDRCNITEILLKVAFKHHKPNPTHPTSLVLHEILTNYNKCLEI